MEFCVLIFLHCYKKHINIFSTKTVDIFLNRLILTKIYKMKGEMQRNRRMDNVIYRVGVHWS